ncbi:hypothetical protein AMTR_s00063p00175770 [Amborella trichopoda]|uniref:Reverse transcriptase zinc-binding domain-containing protein n=1 Tax=Amborella trichopoda TaxID=13333 RepID=U5D1G3_AMBTC|nr:hypothetical protein AMTR_s00063p00175770 [Amborella trichopoda]
MGLLYHFFYFPSRPDKVIWTLELKGNFTISSLYEILSHGMYIKVDLKVKRFWSCKVPLRVRAFLWLVGYDDHFPLINCIKGGWYLSQAAYFAKMKGRLWIIFYFAALLLQRYGLGLKDLFLMRSKSRDVASVIQTVHVLATTWTRAYSPFSFVTKEPRFLHFKDWLFFKQRRGSCSIVWTPPPAGWLKLNFDGSVILEERRAGFGGVLRDDTYRGSMPFNDINEVELRVVRGVLQHYPHHSRLAIEGESVNVIS